MRMNSLEWVLKHYNDTSERSSCGTLLRQSFGRGKVKIHIDIS